MNVSENTFIGVYSTSELPSALGASVRPMVKRKRQWLAWSATDGSYIVQPLNALLQPMAPPRAVSAKEFANRYTHDPSSHATPPAEGVPDAMHDDGYQDHAFEQQSMSSFARANDPELLLSWVEAGVPIPRGTMSDMFSPRQEAELARLVTDNTQVNLPADVFAGNVSTLLTAQRLSPEEREKEFRAEFAMALINIKQGSRDEGMAQLATLIGKPSMDFDGAAALFSELGLNLRRLGLLKMSLSAHFRALDMAPGDERIHFNLARTYHDLNHITQAKEHLNKALEIAPDFAAARQFLDFLGDE